jgi:hypothetical protein
MMKNINQMKIFLSKSFLIALMILSILVVSSCKELPSESQGPDNPLDPNNPNNDIQGPALILSPTDVEINSGEEFELDLWIVETDSTAGISTRITFDPTEFSVTSADSLTANSESFLLENGGQLIWFSTINNESGFVEIDCAVVEGTPRNVIGTGIVARILFQHLTGMNSSIEISNQSLLRDNQNNALTINTLYDANITAK